MSDILREVDEAMRAEKLAALWNEHKTAVIAGVAALILGTAAHAGWNHWNLQQKRETTSALLTALENPKPYEALRSVAEKDNTNYKSLSLMTAAAHAIEEQKFDEASDMYKRVIEDRGAPAVFRDLAIVQNANITLDRKPDATADELLKAVEPVAKDAKSPWQGQALFTRAVIKAHKAKDMKGAIADLELVTTNAALPSSLRSRAQALIDVYQLKGQS